MSWMAVFLKAVPWGDVIDNAPKVVEGARRLWQSASKKRTKEAPDQTAAPTVAPQAESLPELELRVIALETELAKLRGELGASAELIGSLADQNAQLIKQVETNRVRMLWLTLATAIAGTIALVTLSFTLSRFPS